MGNQEHFGPVNSNVLNWFEILFSDRLGIPCSCEISLEGFILTCKSVEGKIVFDNWNHNFYELGTEIDMSYYYPSSDGLVSILEEPIPSPGGIKSNGPLFEIIDSVVYVHYDLPGLFYWVLNRIEEINSTHLDSHNRFAAVSSHAYINNYLDRPIVDEWFLILKQILKLNWQNLSFINRNFELRVSHDVDLPSSYAFESWFNIFKSVVVSIASDFNIYKAFSIFMLKFKFSNKYLIYDKTYTFDWIIKKSNKYGLKSCFYFLVGNTNREFDSNYKFDHPLVLDLLKKINNSGHEIGLHPSYETYDNFDLLKREVDRFLNITQKNHIFLNDLGVRMHYLRCHFPLTIRILDDLDIHYDTTLGYADKPGFRCGTCIDYVPFDPVKSRILSIRIFPLIVMDDTIVSSKYMNLGTGEQALKIVLKLKDSCKAVNGNFTLLWHNCNLNTTEKMIFYEKILAL
jgi:hypothetical protein